MHTLVTLMEVYVCAALVEKERLKVLTYRVWSNIQLLIITFGSASYSTAGQKYVLGYKQIIMFFNHLVRWQVKCLYDCGWNSLQAQKAFHGHYCSAKYKECYKINPLFPDILLWKHKRVRSLIEIDIQM